MNIYYQWNPWSYMNIASKEITKGLNVEIKDIIWKSEFNDVWKSIDENWIWVLAIENSYMWSIHQNIYNFLKYDFKIIWEYYLEINHCLCSLENNIKNIEYAYSQIPALEQCNKYLKQREIKPKVFSDTALSAKYISEKWLKWVWAICSVEAANLYWLNILEKNISDQKWNTTRFIIVAKKDSNLEYNKKNNKTGIIFEAKDIPSSLYKCLWAFATNDINLKKIESMPSYKWSFSYHFWLEFEASLSDAKTKKALEELDFFTKKIIILW